MSLKLDLEGWSLWWCLIEVSSLQVLYAHSLAYIEYEVLSIDKVLFLSVNNAVIQFVSITIDSHVVNQVIALLQPVQLGGQ